MLSANQIRAARLLAEGWLTRRQICKRLSINRSTIFVWQNSRPFVAQVEEFRAAYKQAVRTTGIASLENRVRLYNQLQAKFRRIIRERAKAMKDVAGGSTGLMVRRQKMLGSGPTATLIEEVEVDTALTKELRETMTQAAKELGQLDRAGDDDVKEEKVIRVRHVKRKTK